MLIPTARLLVVALFGLLPIALAPTHDAAIVIAVLWLAAVVLVAGVDAYLLPRAGGLHWSRERDDRLSLASANAVTLQLRNRTDLPVVFRFRDAVPALLREDGASGDGRCDRSGSWSYTYQVIPLHRGQFTLGPLTVRRLGPLGLIWRQSACLRGDEVKVYPDLHSLQRYDALVRRGQLDRIGLRRVRRWGEGTEFERLREYTPDDEFRRIDWKATARSGAPIVIDYGPERSQNVIIAVDTGRAMAGRLPLALEDGTKPAAIALTRLDLSLNAALLLAHVTIRFGDRLGLVAFGDRIERYLPPRTGQRQFLAVIDAMYDLEPSGLATDYSNALAYLAARTSRRSLIVLFTDVTETEMAADLLSPVARLARRHLLLVATMQDPSIRALAEAPIKRRIDVYQRMVARTVEDDRESLLVTLRRNGVLTLDSAANALTPAVINQYLEIKARGRL